MVKFITRIQLHAAQGNDYARLQLEMEKQSFAIVNNDRHVTAATVRNADEYKRTGESVKDINDAVFRAVRQLGSKYAFTVRKEKRV